MLQQVSLTIDILFILLTLCAIYLFYKASNNSKKFLIIIFLWMIAQMILSLSGFYKNEFSTPPRFGLMLLPPLVMTTILFISKPGKSFIDQLNIKKLTLLHTIRIFVEIILYALFIVKTIPQIMSFEGFNFDIIAGITAPIIYYFTFVNKKFSNSFLLVWNIISLALLFNIIVIAFLSLKTPFQKFGFDQPNIALNYFPFVWLPSVVVPLVLFSHLATIRQLTRKNIQLK